MKRLLKPISLISILALGLLSLNACRDKSNTTPIPIEISAGSHIDSIIYIDKEGKRWKETFEYQSLDKNLLHLINSKSYIEGVGQKTLVTNKDITYGNPQIERQFSFPVNKNGQSELVLSKEFKDNKLIRLDYKFTFGEEILAERIDSLFYSGDKLSKIEFISPDEEGNYSPGERIFNYKGNILYEINSTLEKGQIVEEYINQKFSYEGQRLSKIEEDHFIGENLDKTIVYELAYHDNGVIKKIIKKQKIYPSGNFETQETQIFELDSYGRVLSATQTSADQAKISFSYFWSDGLSNYEELQYHHFIRNPQGNLPTLNIGQRIFVPKRE